MWTKAQDLRFSVMMGLRKGLRLIRGMRRAFDAEMKSPKSKPDAAVAAKLSVPERVLLFCHRLRSRLGKSGRDAGHHPTHARQEFCGTQSRD
jgi:hypothetical protein